jgi:hypothetical protein
MTQDEFDAAFKALSKKVIETPDGNPMQAVITILSSLGDAVTEGEALIRAGHDNDLSISYAGFYGSLSFKVWWALARTSWFLTEETRDFVSLCPNHPFSIACRGNTDAAP